MKSLKKICGVVLGICFLVLVCDSFAVADRLNKKQRTRVERYRERTTFKIPPPNTQPLCTWSWQQKFLYVVGQQPGGCTTGTIGLRLKGSCSNVGTVSGCSEVFAQFIYMTVDANCSKTVWNYSGCVPVYPSYTCGENQNLTADTCFTVSNFPTPPYGSGYAEVDLYYGNCSGTPFARVTSYVDCQKGSFPGTAIYSLTSNPCQ